MKSVCESLLYGEGKPHIETKINIFQLIVLVLLIFPLGLNFGIIGVCIAVVIQFLSSLLPMFKKTLDELKMETKSLFQPIGIPIIGTLIMVAIIIIIRDTALFGSGWMNLVGLIFSGMGSYLIFILLMHKLRYYNLIKEIKILFK